MNKIILVAHGNGGNGTFSIPKVKTITPANKILTFKKAKEYIEVEKSWPEYASTSFNEFGSLSDADCELLFDSIPNVGPGPVRLGLFKGGDLGGTPVYALRGAPDYNTEDLYNYITMNGITSVVLLACRG